jgi:hypothetical protein
MPASMAATEEIMLEHKSEKSVETKNPSMLDDRMVSSLQEEETDDFPLGGYQLYKRRFSGIVALVSVFGKFLLETALNNPSLRWYLALYRECVDHGWDP